MGNLMIVVYGVLAKWHKHGDLYRFCAKLQNTLESNAISTDAIFSRRIVDHTQLSTVHKYESVQLD